jgi:hypothetical protein
LAVVSPRLQRGPADKCLKAVSNFTSNIVSVVYSQDSMNLRNTDDFTVKSLTLIIPVAPDYRITFYWRNTSVWSTLHSIPRLDGFSAAQTLLICFGATYESR